MLDRGWTKIHGYFIQMGGFILFEGNVAKGVLSPEKFSELFTAGKIEIPTVTAEEIEDRSKADGFSKRSPSAKHCGSSRSVLREELSISISLLSSC